MRRPLREADFVGEAILELLRDNRIEELFYPPDIINPLSVSVQSSGKKRLILDLRHVNLHVYKQKFKCEGLHTIRSAFSFSNPEFLDRTLHNVFLSKKKCILMGDIS